MSRSLKKGFYCEGSLIKKVNKILLNNSKKFIKTWSRRSTILPIFDGFTMLVHNGNKHLPVLINKDMIGHKLGEFSLTRTFKKHSSSTLNKSKKFFKKK